MIRERRMSHIPGWTERIGRKLHERSYYEEYATALDPSQTVWQSYGAPQGFVPAETYNRGWELVRRRAEIKVVPMSSEWSDEVWDEYEEKMSMVSQYHLKRTYLDMPGCHRQLVDQRVSWRAVPVATCDGTGMYELTDRLLTWSRNGWELTFRHQSFTQEQVLHVARVNTRGLSLTPYLLQRHIRQPRWETETSQSLMAAREREMALESELEARRERERLARPRQLRPGQLRRSETGWESRPALQAGPRQDQLEAWANHDPETNW